MTEQDKPVEVTEEVVVAESAPELDEQEAYKPPSKVTINKRKQFAVRVSQNREFAQKNDIQFIAFFEGAELPVQISAHCGPEMVQAVVAHLAVYFNRDFNEAIEFVRNNYQTKPYDASEPAADEPANEGDTRQSDDDGGVRETP